MQILPTIGEFRAARKLLAPQTLGLVPTMGALHEGHLSLVRAARAACDRVAVSIFVNPTQFGPNEDFAQYPRTFDADCAMLEREGVDLLFAPTPAEMYPQGATTFIDVPALSSLLDGGSRPGHFRGVATVVAKLFHIVAPTHTFFGQKDAAQVAVLQAMVRDLNFNLELIACPTVREADGLALSSRNRYLSLTERQDALTLSRALRSVEAAAQRGEREPSDLRERLNAELQKNPNIRVDYAEIVSRQTLQPVTDLSEGALAAVAAYVGKTRLIDNLILPPSEEAVR